MFVHGQGHKREQKHTTKKFVGFHIHSPLLTMLLTRIILNCNGYPIVLKQKLFVPEQKGLIQDGAQKISLKVKINDSKHHCFLI